jgi:hypothetical protein
MSRHNLQNSQKRTQLLHQLWRVKQQHNQQLQLGWCRSAAPCGPTTASWEGCSREVSTQDLPVVEVAAVAALLGVGVSTAARIEAAALVGIGEAAAVCCGGLRASSWSHAG